MLKLGMLCAMLPLPAKVESAESVECQGGEGTARRDVLQAFCPSCELLEEHDLVLEDPVSEWYHLSESKLHQQKQTEEGTNA